MPAFTPRLLPASAAAAYIGVSPTTLGKLGIPRRTLGTRKLYDVTDLDAFADSLAYEGEKAKNTCDDLLRRSG